MQISRSSVYIVNFEHVHASWILISISLCAMPQVSSKEIKNMIFK